MTITAQSAYNVQPSGCKSGLIPRKGTTKSVRGHFHISNTMRALCISDSPKTGAWLTKAFASERSVQVELQHAYGTAEGILALRNSNFDVALIFHTPGELDAPDFVAAYRSSGIYVPALILGYKDDADLKARCYQVGADDYIYIYSASVRNLLWAMTRANKRFRLEEENARLRNATQQILARDKDEAKTILDEQRSLIEAINTLYEAPNLATRNSQHATQNDSARKSFAKVYRKILCTYVVMGTGCMSKELQNIATLLVQNGISARDVMTIHLNCVRKMIEELSDLSSRHTLARADELLIELMIHLNEEERG